jgi:hypothetical protein
VNAEEPLPGDDFIRVTPDEKTMSDPEKIDFPAAVGPVPTYEAAFGYEDDEEDDMPPPGARSLGPRFYMQNNAQLAIDDTQLAGPLPVNGDTLAQSYFAQTTQQQHQGYAPQIYHSRNPSSQPSIARAPSPVYSRDGSETSSHSGLPSSVRPLIRHTSQASYSSSRSTESSTSSHSTVSKEIRPRWVIE